MIDVQYITSALVVLWIKYTFSYLDLYPQTKFSIFHACGIYLWKSWFMFVSTLFANRKHNIRFGSMNQFCPFSSLYFKAQSINLLLCTKMMDILFTLKYRRKLRYKKNSNYIFVIYISLYCILLIKKHLIDTIFNVYMNI